MSIFQEELKFEPLTAKRRLLLKAEIAIYLIGALLIGLTLWWLLEKAAFDKALASFTAPVLAPLRLALQQFFNSYLAPFLLDCVIAPIQKFSSAAGVPGLMRELNYLFAGSYGALRQVFSTLLPLSPVMLLLAYHNGLFAYRGSPKGETGVLEAELKKWRVLHFGPRVILALQKRRTVVQESFGIFVFMLVTWMLAFALSSGVLSNWLPGCWWREMDNGVTHFYFACLRDANIQVPTDWIRYMDQEVISCAVPLEMKANFWKGFYELFLNPFHNFLPSAQPMPADLWNFRMFVAAVSSLVATVPFTLMSSSWGLDRLVPSKLIVSPTFITLKRRFDFFSSSKFRWDDLLSLTLIPGKNAVFLLSFRGGQKLKVDLQELKEEDRKLFFQAIDELGTGCQVAAEIRKAYFPAAGNSSVAYTLFWEDALASRRKSTVFVPLKDGDVLGDGRITIQRQLAGQGWAATYLARCQDRLVVLRESYLSDESEQSRKAAEMLQRESRILLGLQHKSIAEVLDSFVENGRSYLILEYVPGRDLRQHVELSGALPQSTVIRLALQICSILEYLHGQDPPVIHRDLSPDNLVLTESGAVRLIDFGASKQSIENATGTLIGKQAFMAPEQLRGKACVKSDIYAFGATLYWLLTACEPLALSQSQAQSKVSEISPELNALIAEMTSFEADERPVSVAEIRARLEQLPLEEEAGAVIALAKKMAEICKVASTPFKQLKEEAEHD